jgi:hypothetical protein
MLLANIKRKSPGPIVDEGTQGAVILMPLQCLERFRGFHMTVFTKKELQAQINNIDTRIALLKLPSVTEDERNQADLQKLNAARSELLEKMKVAPE